MTQNPETNSELAQLFELAQNSEEAAAHADELKTIASGADAIVLPAELVKDGPDTGEESAAAMISALRIPEKIKLALYGNKVARGTLIKDRYRQIPLFVLQNPRLTESEVLEFAKNTGLEQVVLRAIAAAPTWIKSYAIKLAIVSNPKVPIDASIRFVPHLLDKDLRRLAKSKNIPQAIAVQCRKLAELKQR